MSIILVHVDDLPLACKSKKRMAEIKQFVMKDMGKLKIIISFLGCQNHSKPE